MEAGPHLEVQQFACLSKSILRIILQASKDPSWVSEGSGLTACLMRGLCFGTNGLLFQDLVMSHDSFGLILLKLTE